MRVAVLVSGVGSIMEAIHGRGLVPALVLADRPCRGLEIARSLGIPATLLDRGHFLDQHHRLRRRAYSDAVLGALQQEGVEFVALAGFGTILEGSVLEEFASVMFNTHPSLLPSFPGWHAVEQALANGVKVTGTTVHLVVPTVDAGPIIAQEPVRVLPGDDVDSLHQRIKEVERWLYPSVLVTAQHHAVRGQSWWSTDSFYAEFEQEVQRCRP
ncbi:MAG: phosphoribosylglycinamide formyltransferase [Ferrimicrobium sp.]|uniref:Phosphoribosylglycinamide formyltransferase n=1 Tax=Ferrimicrobium acidiphilum TaxID=121039 RepID=A0ABV3Y2R8_9ACTN|nr:phosphoribosylglycinamide formyltransferase [Ferrimicrobium sp.]MCL5972931.1 phosphoribosylglycinamide formyltransferase [Actinomycetota bacterium]